MKFEIHEEKNCAWCYIDDIFIYSKDVNELKAVLDKIALEMK